jgi:hypothetical protein
MIHGRRAKYFPFFLFKEKFSLIKKGLPKDRDDQMESHWKVTNTKNYL